MLKRERGREQRIQTETENESLSIVYRSLLCVGTDSGITAPLCDGELRSGTTRDYLLIFSRAPLIQVKYCASLITK